MDLFTIAAASLFFVGVSLPHAACVDSADCNASPDADSDLTSVLQSRAGRKRPNLVFIVFDDWGYSDVGFRDSNIPTPTMDELASKGIVMNNLYVTPVCSPSRAAFMTGRMPWRFGGANFKPNVDYPYVVPLDEVFFPEVLKASDMYRTALVGKWDMGVATKDLLPASRGFNDLTLEYEPMEVWGGGASHLNYAITSRHLVEETGFQGYFLSSFGLNGKNLTADAIWDIHDGTQCLPDGTGCKHDEGSWKSAFDISYDESAALWDSPDDPYELQKNHSTYSADTFARSAVKVIEKHAENDDGKALFLMLSFTTPHVPVQSPDEYIYGTKCKDYPVPNKYYSGSQIDEASARGSCPQEDYVNGFNNPRTACNDGAWKRYVQCGQFYGMDLAMGSVVDALKKARMWENTVLWFSGDNGGDLPDASSNQPYWGGKSTGFEGGIKVPAIWSGGYLSSQLARYGTKPYESSNMMLLTDVSATFLALAGLNTPDALGGWKTGKDSDAVDQWEALVNPTKVDAPRKDAVVMSGTPVVADAKAAVAHTPGPNGKRWKLMHNPSGWFSFGVHIALYQCAIRNGTDCAALPACIVEQIQILAGNFGKTGSSDETTLSDESVNMWSADLSIPASSDKRVWEKLKEPEFLDKFQSPTWEGCTYFRNINHAANIAYKDGSKNAIDRLIESTEELLQWVIPLFEHIDDWWLFDLDECPDEGGEECHGKEGEGTNCKCNHYCTSKKPHVCPKHVADVQTHLEDLLKKAEHDTNMTHNWYSPVSDMWGDYTQLGWFVNPWRDSDYNALLCTIKDFRTGEDSDNIRCKGQQQ